MTRISSARPGIAALASLSLALAALLLSSATASAFLGRQPIREFGSFVAGRGDTVDQSTGNVYLIEDGGAEEIEVFGPSGEAPVGGGPAKFNGSGNPAKAFKFGFAEFQESAFNAAKDSLWFSDANNNNAEEYKLESGEYKYICQINAIGASGDACTPSGATGTGAFWLPQGVAVDSIGDRYIADLGSSSVYEYNLAGEQIAAIPLGFYPQYVAVGPKGTIYVNAYSTWALYELNAARLRVRSKARRSNCLEASLPGSPSTRALGI